jgi:hypothetical protein
MSFPKDNRTRQTRDRDHKVVAIGGLIIVVLLLLYVALYGWG